MNNIFHQIPKAELHVHLNGTLQPEMLLELAKRNGIDIRYKSLDEIREAYDFTSLDSFLELFFEGARVCVTEQDFFDVMWAYLKSAKSQNIVHVEMHFEPQAHMEHGVAFETVFHGIRRACVQAEQQLGVTTKLILSLLRHLGADAAMACLEEALPFKEHIVAIGLVSTEVGYPPIMFEAVGERAREEGLYTLAHVGEEGPPEYVWQAIDSFKVTRIQHGLRSIEDSSLVERLVADQIPLDMCPVSNLKVGCFTCMGEHNIKTLHERGVPINVSSDDPGFFSTDVLDNYERVHSELDMPIQDLVQMMRNSFEFSFLDRPEKDQWLKTIDEYVEELGILENV